MAMFTEREMQVLQRLVRTILNKRHIELTKIRVLKTRASFYLYDVSQDEMALLDQILTCELTKLGWYSWRSGTNVLSVSKD